MLLMSIPPYHDPHSLLCVLKIVVLQIIDARIKPSTLILSTPRGIATDAVNPSCPFLALFRVNPLPQPRLPDYQPDSWESAAATVGLDYWRFVGIFA